MLASYSFSQRRSKAIEYQSRCCSLGRVPARTKTKHCFRLSRRILVGLISFFSASDLEHCMPQPMDFTALRTRIQMALQLFHPIRRGDATYKVDPSIVREMLHFPSKSAILRKYVLTNKSKQ